MVPVVANTPHALPAYSTPDSADPICAPNGRACGTAGERILIPTDRFCLATGFEAQVRPRTAFFKHGVTVLNSPGTIDADYCGDVGVILINHGHTTVEGCETCPAVPARHERLEWAVIDTVEQLPDSTRGAGVGHTEHPDDMNIIVPMAAGWKLPTHLDRPRPLVSSRENLLWSGLSRTSSARPTTWTTSAL